MRRCVIDLILLLLVANLVLACDPSKQAEEDIPAAPRHEISGLQEAQLIFEASDPHPEFMVTLRWEESLGSDSTVPLVSRLLYEMTTDCLVLSERTSSVILPLRITPHSTDIGFSVSNEISSCLLLQARQVRTQLDHVNVDTLYIEVIYGDGVQI